MIQWEIRMLIRHMLDQGVKKAAIARRTGVHRRTIDRWIAAGDLDREGSSGAVVKPVRRRGATKLAAYEETVRERLTCYPELTAVRLFEELKAAGYRGGISQLRAYVARVRPRPAPEPLVRFETAPGEQGQVDFAEFNFPWGKRYALLVVLGYSRLLWLRFYERQDMRTLFEGLEAAFASFGGVPRELLFDQMASVITRDLRGEGGHLVENAEFLRFARHWGFRVRACRPYRAKTKGKVERPIRYLRASFVYARDFVSDDDLNAQAERWLSGIANVRTHRTTGERPIERFLCDEKETLLTLPARPYRSLVLAPGPAPRAPRSRVPQVEVERRALKSYAMIAAGLP